MEFRTFFSLASLLLLTSEEMITEGEEHFLKEGEPIGKVAFEGESCQFSCKMDGLRPKVEYFVWWQFTKDVTGSAQGNDKIVDSEKYGVSTNLKKYGSRLDVYNITINDQGFYSCWLYKGRESFMGSRSGQLKVIQMPSFRKIPMDKSVVEGQSVILRCSLDSFVLEDMYITWFLNGVNCSRNYLVNQSSVPEYLEGLRIDNSAGPGAFDLHINRVERKGAGTLQFQCKVYLEGRRRSILKSSAVEITVIYPPASEFPKCSPSKLQDYYKEGEVFKTSCWAMGGNAPVYFHWYKNGEMRNVTVVNNQQLVSDEWNVTEADDGKYIKCFMKGRAILQERQCTIGPINVQVPTKVPFTITYDARTAVAATSGFRSRSKFTSHIFQSKPTLSASLISRLSPVTQGSVSVKKAGTTYSAYIIIFLLLVFISALVVIAVFIVRKRRIEREKKNVKEPLNVNERENANFDLAHYEEARSPKHARDELSLQPELNVEKIELPLNDSSKEPLTNEDVAVGTADVTYAQVCKVKLPKTKQDMGEEKKSRNVEGLIYADLDLRRSEARDLTAAKPSLRDDSSVTYAEVQISRPPSTRK